MNEGEKLKKKVYKRGDVVTFRLLKKLNFSENVVSLINEANEKNTLNIEMISALELYAKYKKYVSSVYMVGMTENEISFFKNIGQAKPKQIEDDYYDEFEEIAPKNALKIIRNEEVKVTEEKLEPELDINEESSEIIDKKTYDPADEVFEAPKISTNGLAKAFRSLGR